MLSVASFLVLSSLVFKKKSSVKSSVCSDDIATKLEFLINKLDKH